MIRKHWRLVCHLAVSSALLISLDVAAAPADVWSELDVPWSAEVRMITGSPADPSVVYALAARIGAVRVLRSADGGVNWTRADHGLPDNLFPSVLAVAPSDPQTAYFADIHGGLYNTGDGGQHWSAVNDKPFDGNPRAITIHPVDPTIVYLATSSDLYRTQDGGDTWSGLAKKFPDDPRAVEFVVFDPTTPSTLYAWRDRTDGVDAGQFYRSVDGGESWTYLQNMEDVAELVVDPTDGNVLYVAQHITIGPFEGGWIQKSSDGGVSWDFILGDDMSSSGVYTDIDIDPNDSAVLYAANPSEGRLWQSVDAGANWSVVRSEPYGQGPGQVYAAPSNPTTLLVAIADNTNLAHNEAVLRSVDDGASWTVAVAGLGGGATTELAVDPNDANRLYARAGYELPLYRSDDSGVSWSEIGGALLGYPRSPRSLYIAPSSSNVLYLQTDTHTYRSGDTGASWAPADSGLPSQPYALAVDPVDSNIVYAPVGGVHKTSDGGASWSQISSFAFGSTVLSLTIDASDPAKMYAGAAGAVFKSSDGGTSWTSVLTEDPGCFFSTIFVAGSSPQRVYALCTGGNGALWISGDGGATWAESVPATGSHYLTALGVDASAPATAYVALEDFFHGEGYRTDDGGLTWRRYDAGLGAGARIYTLAVATGGAVEVYAGTDAGLYAQVCTSTPPLCDDGDPCTQDCHSALAAACINAPVVPSSCLTASKSNLIIKYKPADPAKSQLKWLWKKGEAFAQADLGDPTATTGYDLCVYDDSFTAFASGVDAAGSCGTGPCWSAASSKGYKYKNKAGNADSITLVSLAGGAAGKSKAIVKAKGAGVPSAGLPVGGDVRVALYRRDGDLCLQSRFAGGFAKGEIISNRSTLLKARVK